MTFYFRAGRTSEKGSCIDLMWRDATFSYRLYEKEGRNSNPGPHWMLHYRILFLHSMSYYMNLSTEKHNITEISGIHYTVFCAFFKNTKISEK